jgi:hypothetical protein
MGLSNALIRLHADRAVDSAVRDVLLAFHRHQRTPLSVEDVVRLANRSPAVVAPILTTLAQTFVLDCDGNPPRYSYVPDALLRIDTERYLQRVEAVEGRLQNNVARFRQRHSY